MKQANGHHKKSKRIKALSLMFMTAFMDKSSLRMLYFKYFRFFIHGGPINQGWLLFRGPWKKPNYNVTKKNFYNAKLAQMKD